VPIAPPSRRGLAAAGLILLALGGCRLGIPAYCLNEPTIFDAPKSSLEPINFIRLRQDPPPVYLLGPGDVLGIYIERVLGEPEVPPPVHFPEDPTVPPVVGYPTPVREDGTVSLPLVPPIRIEGLTVAQAERLIRDAYTVDRQILPPGEDRILVTLMRRRTYQVLVIREDTLTKPIRQTGEGELMLGSGKRGETYAVELPAYENDVLHALAESGGLPGVDAKNEVVILRGGFADAKNMNPFIVDFFEGPQPGTEPIQTPMGQILTPNPNVTRIPLRRGPYTPPVEIKENDIILNNGDVVYIESREAEVFYTGGLIKGGQFPIPRDYDLDVLGAIAMGGGSIASVPGGAGSRGVGVGFLLPPTRILVIRTISGQQTTIRLNLKNLLERRPEDRILVQPNDVILLKYTTFEMLMNVILSQVQFNYFLNSFQD